MSYRTAWWKLFKVNMFIFGCVASVLFAVAAADKAKGDLSA